jgi:hypothetical protein
LITRPFGDLDLDPFGLDRIGVFDGDVGIGDRQLADLRARLLGPVQAFGGRANFFLGEGHDDLKKQVAEIYLTC